MTVTFTEIKNNHVMDKDEWFMIRLSQSKLCDLKQVP